MARMQHRGLAVPVGLVKQPDALSAIPKSLDGLQRSFSDDLALTLPSSAQGGIYPGLFTELCYGRVCGIPLNRFSTREVAVTFLIGILMACAALVLCP